MQVISEDRKIKASIQIKIDINRGVYKQFPKLEKRLSRIYTQLVLKNGTITGNDFHILKTNEYI